MLHALVRQSALGRHARYSAFSILNWYKAIGAALAIGEGTVKFHVNNILGKRGASDRTHVVTLALQHGIIHLDQSP